MMTYIYAALGAVILALGGALAWRTHQYDKAQQQIGQLTLDLGKAISANADQQRTIDALTRANAEFANVARLHATEYRDLLADHVRLRVQWNAAEAARMIRERNDKTIAACRAVLDIDLSGPCPGTSDAIRDRAR